MSKNNPQRPAETEDEVEVICGDEELEEEEPFHGYFLTPVNEYNIREKIERANEELYMEMKNSDEEEGHKRRVTFRSNLEDYEPDEEVIDIPSSASSQDIIEEDLEDTRIVEETTGLEDTLNSLSLANCSGGEEEEEGNNESHEEEYDEEEHEIVIEAVPERVTQSEESIVEPCPSVHTNESPISTRKEPERVKRSAEKRPQSSPAVFQSTSVKYKSCCENKHKKQERKLPRYMGDLSEYGLSKDQLEWRAERMALRRRSRQESAYRKYQLEQERIRLNEAAFAQWMTLKLAKIPKNKYANRYDETSPKRRPRNKAKIAAV